MNLKNAGPQQVLSFNCLYEVNSCTMKIGFSFWLEVSNDTIHCSMNLKQAVYIKETENNNNLKKINSCDFRNQNP